MNGLVAFILSLAVLSCALVNQKQADQLQDLTKRISTLEQTK